MSWCATCDGALYRGRTVAVVGGGDSAVEEGMFLTKFADKVYLVHRRDELRAAPIAQERASPTPSSSSSGTRCRSRSTAPRWSRRSRSRTSRPARCARCRSTACSCTSARSPTPTWLKGIVELDEYGYIVTDELLRTELPGVFACGDAHANPLKQIVMAVGEGALAAVQAETLPRRARVRAAGRRATAAGGSAAAPA